MKLYNGLTYDAHKGALATVTAEYHRAFKREDIKATTRWGREIERINQIMANWETLAVEQS